MNIFPNLKKGIWIELNLNEESRKTSLDLTDPENCTSFINKLQENKKADYSYGGFLEDRSYIWRNHPNAGEGASLIHLGVDYNVAAGTEVCLPAKGEVIHILKDPDNKLGWGGRIMWKLDNGLYLIYGHLKQNINLKIGQLCKKGQIIGIIGDKKENGSWFPHLHVQLMDSDFISHYTDFSKIDGYLSKNHPDLKHVLNPGTIIHSS